MRVLMISSEWPTPERPHAVPFIVRQVDFLRRAGVDVEVFHFRGGGNPLNYFHAWRRVRRLMREERFDLLHTQWGQSALLALPKNRPLVVTFRGDDVHGIVDSNRRQTFQGIVLRLVTRYAARKADERIVVSQSLATQLKIEDHHIIPSGIDLTLFHPDDKRKARQILNLPVRKDLILFAGDLHTPRKRLPLIREAVQLLQVENPNAELICAGAVPHEKMPLYMSACDVLILASVHEGSPNVVKEALACNLPVVSTDVGDVRERIGSVDGCVVCADDKPETLAASIQSVLSRNKRIDGRKTVLNLDETILTQRLISVYKKAIGGGII